MITNKDIRVENGSLIINGDPYPLDGQSPETIMGIVEDNSDSTPTENSTAPVTSGGVYTALAGKQDTLTFDDAPTENSTKPVKSGGVYTALGTKQDTLTFDNAPTASSDNPVKSDGIKTYVDDKYYIKGQHLGESLLVSAGSFGRAAIPCAETGYTAIGVLSVQGAALAGAVTLMEFGLGANSDTVYVYFANNTAANITLPDVNVRVLYRKN